jgi:hypothetical protein
MSDPSIESKRRNMAVVGLAVSMLILLPGLFSPVLTVRGTLNPDGVAVLAPQLLDRGITDSTLESLRPILNPAMIPFLELAPGGLKGAITSTLGTQLAAQLRAGEPIEVYSQTRSILGSVKHLYRVGSYTAATLILLFSVMVPLAKALTVLFALYQKSEAGRRRNLLFVEMIAKWAMADVFAVALFITYLAAQASQAPLGENVVPPVLTFDASFGIGFYWFAAYCLFSLALQQATARWFAASTAAGAR